MIFQLIGMGATFCALPPQLTAAHRWRGCAHAESVWSVDDTVHAQHVTTVAPAAQEGLEDCPGYIMPIIVRGPCQGKERGLTMFKGCAMVVSGKEVKGNGG